MKNNFTSDKNYRLSLYLRFFFKKIKSSDNLDIVRYYDGNNCFQYFDVNINDNDIKFLSKMLKTSSIKFRNINKDSELLKILKDKFEIEITKEWDAPILVLKKNKFEDYANSKSSNFRRMIYKNETYKKHLKFQRGNKEELWKDVLNIDQNSWKMDSESDMMNLYYEHISWISLIKNSVIEIAYLESIPIGYSLLFYYNGVYYAAKWGATNEGRKYNAGIICLLNQIKRINKNNDIYLDFWGRDNKIYDRIKNGSIRRVYFTIKKNGSKKDKIK